MDITVLGPLQVDAPEHLGPRERVVLSALALQRGHVVSTLRLADAVWADSPPSSWRKQLQASVVRLRRALGSDRILTTAGGYLLRVEADEIDVERFETAVARGRVHAAQGEPERAVAEFRGAQGMLKGTPWFDLGGWPDAIGETERICEIARSVEDELLHARLAAGDHGGVAEDAPPLATAEPLRERRWSALALAQYRSGRQGDALATLRRARRALVEELGAEPGVELVDLESAILGHDPTLLAVPEPSPTGTECPYPGLSPYGPDDEDRFFGRDSDIARAVEHLSSNRFLLLAGPSGCGKSSLARAGVAPVFARRGSSLTLTTPSTELVGLLAPDEGSTSSGDRLIVIDQFEELFALPDSSRISEYCAAVAELVEGGCRVAVLVRSDLLDACARQPALAALLPAGLRLLSVPERQSLKQTIEGPALAAGLRFEPGLVELLLDEADGHPGVLPLLSHALAETWRRREGPVLTLAGYKAAGGLSGAVARSAERLYQSLGTHEKDVCRGLLLRLVSLTSSGMAVQHPLPLLAFAGDASHERVIGRLTGARLLSVEADTVSLTHESVARAWPRLREWLEEDADGKRALDHLAGAANAWDESGRSDDELYRGARLGTVLEWQRAATLRLTPREEQFLGASVRRQADETAQRDAVARREARQNVILRRLLTAGAGLLATALVAGTLAVLGGIEAGQRSDESRRAEAEAQLSALVSSSEALRSSARDVAALLAIEAYRRWPNDPRTRSALVGTFTAAPGFLGYARVDGTGSLRGGVLPDDAHAVVALESGAIALLDLASGAVLQRYGPPPGARTPISAMAISSDGGRAVVAHPAIESRCSATAHGCSEVAVLDVGAGTWRSISLAVDAIAEGLAVDETGATGALVDASTGRVIVLRLSDGESLATIDPAAAKEPTRGAPAAIAFLSGGGLAVGSPGGVQLVDLTAGVTRHVATPPLTANQALVDAGDGMLVGSGDKGMVAIDAAAGSVRWSVGFDSPHPVPCPRLAASVLAETAYCGDFFGGIEERSLRDGSLTGGRFDPQLGDVGELAVSRDGNTLVSIGAEEPVVSRWRLDGSGLAAKLVAAGQVVFDSYDSAGGSFVTAARPTAATVDVDFNDFAVWDADTDAPVRRIDEPVQGLGWAGQGMLVGFFESDGTIGFYDLAAGQRVPGVAIPLEAYHLWPAASGSRLYAGFEDGTLWTIDMTTRQRIAPTLHVDGTPTSVSTSADGSVVLVSAEGAGGATMSLINGRTGAVIVPPVSGPRMSVLAPDGSVFGARGGHITRYDAQLRPIDSIAGARGGLASLQVSEDGAVLLASANDQTVSVFDARTGVRLGDPLASFAPFIGPGFLRPDGLAAAVTGRHGVIVWDLDPAHLATAACTFAGRNLTAEEWSSHLSGLGPWRATCP